MGISKSYHFEEPYLKPEKFIGRQAELEYLKTRIVNEKRRVGLLTGNNATGKTWLILYFVSYFLPELKPLTEFIDFYDNYRVLPELKADTQLVIVDGLAYDFNKQINNQVLHYIDQYPDKQFILVSPHENELVNKHINYKLRLNNLSKEESLSMVTKLLEKKLGTQQAVKLISLTEGNPYLINLLSNYLNDSYRNYTFDNLIAMVYEKIQVSGITDKFGQSLTHTSQTFKSIVSDIQIINTSFLDQIKQHPEGIHKLLPREFEEMVAELMYKRGYTVDLTKATRDGGKDLIIAQNKDIGNFIYYVECKRYSPENPVGVHLVRELGGTVLADRVTAGIMITSSYFTKKAVEYSHKLEHQISLVDFIKLKEWLKF